jgi:hypothetical protein
MRSIWPLTILIAVLATLAGTAPAAAQPSRTFTLQPTGRATITFIAFCTEFGDKYPDQLLLPSGVAQPEVRAAIQYIADNGLAGESSRALQGQYAIWTLLGQAGPAGDALAQQVVTYARANPVRDPQATSLLDAARAGQVRLTLQSWTPAGPVTQITSTARDNFYGRGQLLVENTSNQAVNLYMPVGTLFPPTVQPHQVMASYLENVQVTNPTPQLPNTSGGGSLLALTAALVVGVGLVRLAQQRRGRRIRL